MEKVIIIGTGPAGLTAAIYAARAGNTPLLIAGPQPGGQLTTTTDVENFPGFAHGIMGPKLMQDMTAQAERVGTRIIHESVEKVDFSGRPLRLFTDNQQTFEAQTVIIATGATAKTLNLPGEGPLMGRGLSTCATCDGFFYRNKSVAVIGGGDSAMEEANYLANICQKVYLIHRRQQFRASQIMVERARRNPRIEFLTPYAPEGLLSNEQGVNGVALMHAETGEKKSLMCDGVFYAIGHQPNSEIFKPFVDTDHHGYIQVHNYTATKTPGVFAAGDIADPTFKQAVTAAGMGCQAAIQANRFIEEQH